MAATAAIVKKVNASAAKPYASATAGEPGRATMYMSAATAPQIPASIPPRNNGKSGVNSAGTTDLLDPSFVNPDTVILAVGYDLDVTTDAERSRLTLVVESVD
ncbi:hypothetical protein [Halosimplex amylolyticum]|uniref:hypothetical protein n=1 Tax=Halosimplex amylolyticum TaxID=3396616 RepID=UPI003F5554F5